jgi:mono/diheme cytochrome c family protein
MNSERQLLFILFAGAAALPLSAVAGPTSDPSGTKVFMHSRCFACHGEFGYGGAGPRFRNDKLLASEQYVVSRILLGGGIMPSFAGTLSDQQIAAVANYVRNSWGNNFGPVTPDQVAGVRKTLKGDTEKAPQGESQR